MPTGLVVISTLAKTMKKLLLLLPLVFIPIPAQAITWDQFWRPFTYNRPYYYNPYPYNRPYYYPAPYGAPYMIPMCDRLVYREEWVNGYLRRWSERVRVPCGDYD